MTSYRDVCCNMNIYIWQLYGQVVIVHCGSAIVTMGGAATTVTSDAALSVRILCIDVSLSTIAQLVERMTVNHDVTGSSPVGGVRLLLSDETLLSPIDSSGKTYNADLNASYNVGARYFIRHLLKTVTVTQRLALEAKVPQVAKRSTCTLSHLINLRSEFAALTAKTQA